VCKLVEFAVPTFPELSVLLRNVGLSKSVQRGAVRELSGSNHDYNNGHDD
jgi:hypothetical protein